MAISKKDIADFLRLHRYAVQASHAPGGAPQAALVGIVANDRLELFFDSFDSTRKTANLRRDPRVAFVIGGHTTGDERTVQYEGVVDTPVGAELDAFKQDYFTAHPDGLRRSQLAGITYFRVRPVWIRYTDLNVNPPEIVTLRGPEIGTGDAAAPTPISIRQPAGSSSSEPWQPDLDRKPVFNPFVNQAGKSSSG